MSVETGSPRQVVHTSESPGNKSHHGSLTEEQRQKLLERAGEQNSSADPEASSEQAEPFSPVFSPEEKANMEQLRQELVESAFNPVTPESTETKSEQNFGGPAEMPDDVDSLYGAGSIPATESETSSTDTPPEYQNIYQLNEELQNEAKPVVVPQNIYELNQELREEAETETGSATPAAPEVTPVDTTTETDGETEGATPATPEETPSPTESEPEPVAAQSAPEQATSTTTPSTEGVAVADWRAGQERETTAEQNTPGRISFEDIRAAVASLTEDEAKAQLARLMYEPHRPAPSREAIPDNPVSASAILDREAGAGPDLSSTRQERREARSKKRKFGRGILRTLSWFGSEARVNRKKGKHTRKAEKKHASAAKHEAKVAAIDEKQAESLRQIAENEARKEEFKARRARINSQLAAQTEQARQQRRAEGGNR